MIRDARALRILLLSVVSVSLTAAPSPGLSQMTPEFGVQQSAPDPVMPDPEESAVGSDSSGLAFSGPLLPAGHWAVAAVERAALLLLLPGHLSGQRGLPLEIAERSLRQARESAFAEGSMYAPLTDAWYTRLLDEFPGVAPEAERATPLMLTGRYLGVGIDLTDGRVGPGLAEFEPDRTGALPLDDRATPVAVGRASASWGRHLAIELSGEVDRYGVRVDGAEVAAGLGIWRASLGRGRVAYGSGVGHGGVLMTGLTAINSVQIGTRGAARLPWGLGSASLHTLFARMEEDRHPDRDYFWGANLQYQPHRRITLGIHRAALFGGDEPVTSARLWSMLVGRVAGIGFENQIVAASGRAVLPTESVVPLVLHFEWGAEDAAGSWWAVPGIVAGVEIPAVPTLPALALGAEYAHFATSCCGNPSWYRHWSFPGGWAAGDEPLGHAMGGNGSELSARAALDLPTGRFEARAFGRERGAENLYVPGRDGRSHGVDLRIDVRRWGGWRLLLGGGHESGPSWSESNLRVEVGHF